MATDNSSRHNLLIIINIKTYVSSDLVSLCTLSGNSFQESELITDGAVELDVV